MGQYARTEQMVYEAPVFAQVARQRDEEQFYLFVGRDGLWRVGPNIASYSGSELKNKKKNEATPPRDGWLYYRDNKWVRDVDMHATVHLREGETRDVYNVRIFIGQSLTNPMALTTMSPMKSSQHTQTFPWSNPAVPTMQNSIMYNNMANPNPFLLPYSIMPQQQPSSY